MNVRETYFSNVAKLLPSNPMDGRGSDPFHLPQASASSCICVCVSILEVSNIGSHNIYDILDVFFVVVSLPFFCLKCLRLCPPLTVSVPDFRSSHRRRSEANGPQTAKYMP